MARYGTGSGSPTIIGSALSTPSSYSWHCWWRSTTTPPTGAITSILTFSKSGAAIDFGCSFGHTVADARQSVFHRDNTSYKNAKFTTSLQANTWYSICGTWDGSFVRAWLNGVNETSVVSLSIAGTAPIPAAFSDEGGTTWFENTGTIAEVAYWHNTVLNANEILGLANGSSPFIAHPDGLVLYWPLMGADSPEPDYSGNRNSGTVTTATAAQHPPVRPLRFQLPKGAQAHPY